MTPSHEEDKVRLRRDIDRLVDDELTDAERSQLIVRLDASPESWRQCALAFLEARSWRASFGSFAHSGRTPAERETVERPRPLSLGLFWSGLVGCTLLAFGLGFGLGVRSFGDSEGWNESLGQAAFDQTVLRQGGGLEDRGVVPSADEVRDDPGTLPDAALSSGPIEYVGVIEDPEFEQAVPIVSGPGLDEEWLRRLPPPLTDYERQQLERRGFQVEQGRKLVSIQLRDGEQLMIPIDLVNVQYIGQRVY